MKHKNMKSYVRNESSIENMFFARRIIVSKSQDTYIDTYIHTLRKKYS